MSDRSHADVATGQDTCAVATLTLLAVFLVSYIVLSLVWEDFADYDASTFTLDTLQLSRSDPSPIAGWTDL
jgi:hypothetical protein